MKIILKELTKEEVEEKLNEMEEKIGEVTEKVEFVKDILKDVESYLDIDIGLSKGDK